MKQYPLSIKAIKARKGKQLTPRQSLYLNTLLKANTPKSFIDPHEAQRNLITHIIVEAATDLLDPRTVDRHRLSAAYFFASGDYQCYLATINQQTTYLPPIIEELFNNELATGIPTADDNILIQWPLMAMYLNR